MGTTLVIGEQRDGHLNRATWEAVAGAQQLGQPVKVAILGAAIEEAVAEVSAAAVAEVLAVGHPALEPYTSDGFITALAQLLTQEQPDVVCLAHTYQARDFAPRLAAHVDRTLVTDCIGLKASAEGPLFVRPMFQGKLCADLRPLGDPPHLVTFQVGAFGADAVARGASAASIRQVEVAIDAGVIRYRAEAPFREARQAVDLSQAERIVAVGRGIKSQDNLSLAQALADAVGGEIAASRPICDAGWLPMDRQVGSSGQTVAPQLYVAIGISGAIQHLVGMRGTRTIVAINRDPDAPIFEVADYGIAGDLFEVVPAIVRELQA